MDEIKNAPENMNMKIYIKKFVISSIPLMLLILLISVLTDKFLKEWLIGELLSYKCIEWAVMLIPAVAIAYLKRNKSLLFGAIYVAFASFCCDIFRFGNDPGKDIDIVFYFGASFRAFALSCICLPFVTIGSVYANRKIYGIS